MEQELERRVIETVKRCQERQDSVFKWAFEIGKCISSDKSSPELGRVLVNYLCFNNNHPSLWKFIDYAVCSQLLCAIHILALLTERLVPHRSTQPQAFRLYLELLSRHCLSFSNLSAFSTGNIVQSIDDALQLSQTYKVSVVEFGHAFVLSFFAVVVRLIDALLEDLGLELSSAVDHHSMDVDSVGNCDAEKNEQARTIPVVEVLAKLTESTKAFLLLRLVHFNLPEKFNGLLQRLQLLETNKLASLKLKSATQHLDRLCANIKKVVAYDYKLNRGRFIGMLLDSKSLRPVSSCNHEADWSACWVSYDIYMEHAMDGRQLPVTSAVVILSQSIRTLQLFNRASWQETFLALWLSALRLVKRERDPPPEGPIPHLETRLCVLLSIVPLAISNVLADDNQVKAPSVQVATDTANGHAMDENCLGPRKKGLISSLQMLGHFNGLLFPPSSITGEVNSAAAKAYNFISASMNTNDSAGSDSLGSAPLSSGDQKGGNLRHLIVEACIARNLVDTSAYFWPGYVSAPVVGLADFSPVQRSPWSEFMEGAALDDSLINSLLITPASSLAEIEKIYHIALNGSQGERVAAAKILCGASLSRGWNIQEHVVHFVLKLLSPSVPPGYTGSRSHLVDHMPMLSATLLPASSVDNVHIISLHGAVPELAAALMPLCETFGSLTPTSSEKSSTSDEPSVYMVFSVAFLLLLRLWKFYRPPLEQCVIGQPMVGELTPEYLLLLRNSRLAVHGLSSPDEKNSNLCQLQYTPDKPIYIDYFPRLRAWHCLNKSCIASTPSGICSGSPVFQVADRILNMMYCKMTKSGTTSGNATPNSKDCESTSGDAYMRPMLPAWEVLEAIPFVLEATLSACAYGRLSSRDMTTGLRDLVDLLPASLGGIVTYFAAEVTRGVWKQVPMNGIDWPSPAPILPAIESEMKEILAAAGVNVSLASAGSSTVMLPLPIAALVSLTITFKLSKNLEYIHAVVGPALENCASGCPWPSIPVIGSLWAQKVPRWHDFIVVGCSRAVFRENREAIAQLLRSCFNSFIGSRVSTGFLTHRSSVNSLLGRVIAARPIAPGFLYLRSCRNIQNVQHGRDVIVGLVAEFAREAATRWARSESPRIKSSQASLSLAACKAREVAALGACLVCVTGGLHQVKELFRDTMPTWLLASRKEKAGEVSCAARIIEGYAMAHMLVHSGSLVMGVGSKPPFWAMTRRGRIIQGHLEFLGRVLDGNVSLGCHPVTWRAYVSCLVGLIVSCVPAWIKGVKPETLRKLANGLRGWHECELALSLLERGGFESISSVVELLYVIS